MALGPRLQGKRTLITPRRRGFDSAARGGMKKGGEKKQPRTAFLKSSLMSQRCSVKPKWMTYFSPAAAEIFQKHDWMAPAESPVH